jgi:phosphoribosyl-ATP pyrophosphohydrolase/phosphoribosyl-AMP cyclohydrolase
LDDTLVDRAVNPSEGSYTTKLLTDRNLRLKKLGEEAVELSLACADGADEDVVYETADLLYHALVAARARGVSVADVLAELRRRQS